MQNNWVDLVIVVTLLFFSIESLSRSFILEVLDFASFLLALILSFSLYNFPAKFFETEFNIPHGLSLVLGFMAVWFLTETIFYVLVRTFKLPGEAWVRRVLATRVLSIIPALLKGLIFIALALVMLATFPIQPSIKKAVLDSKIGSQILKNVTALEQPVKNVFGGVTNDSLTFLTIKPKTNERINLGFQTTDFTTDQAAERAMVELVNQERVKRGLKELKLDENLRSIARAYSADMFTRGYFSHYSPEGKTVADRVLSAGIDFLVVGENLAYAPNLESAHKGLMNSEGHRANILSSDYGKIGIGVMDGGTYGKMFVQVFTN